MDNMTYKLLNGIPVPNVALIFTNFLSLKINFVFINDFSEIDDFNKKIYNKNNLK